VVSLPAQYVLLLCSLSQILIAFRCDFVASPRITEPPSSNVNDSEAKDPSIATSLKVLEPPSPLHMLAYYRKMKLSTTGNQPEQISTPIPFWMMWKLTNTVVASVTLTVQLTAGKSQMVTCHLSVLRNKSVI